MAHYCEWYVPTISPQVCGRKMSIMTIVSHGITTAGGAKHHHWLGYGPHTSIDIFALVVGGVLCCHRIGQPV